MHVDNYISALTQNAFQGDVIRNIKELAEQLAHYAHVLADIIHKNGELKQLLRHHFESFESLTKFAIPDVNNEHFSDVYAQTLAYGMFIARYHHKGTNVFTRIVAVESIPKSHPFLRKFFSYIASSELDERLRWVIDELTEALQAANLADIMESFGKQTQSEDPVIHFYENFLTVYNPELRKDIGAFYTPLPAVQYMIQSVDTLLKEEFDCPAGLADNTTIQYINEEVHRVQILDPATGTGTFLAETVKYIHSLIVSQGKSGAWNSYVAQDLLPRLHGFEILMAPYAMAHLKLDTFLEQSGYRFENDQRLGIYLTNALDEGFAQIERLPFAQWLSDEAEGASRIMKSTPVMVVLGNPPYNNFMGTVSHFNETNYAKHLIAKYKTGLADKKLNLDDAYIKFIALGQNFIEKNRNSCGILAYISNNSFLDGITHRQMRKVLLETFDKIYIINLHGNHRKKEKSPDGSKDENVFDIQVGTSINIFVKLPEGKRKHRRNLPQIFYVDLFGKRQEKFDFLSNKRLKTTGFEPLEPVEPYYFFVPKDFRKQKKYEKGFSLRELFPIQNSGIKTDRDELFIDFDKEKLAKQIKTLLSGDYDWRFENQYRVVDSSSYKLTQVIQEKRYDSQFLQKIAYRPFDDRWIYYDPAIISRPAGKVMQHIVNNDNLALIVSRQVRLERWNHVCAANGIVECGINFCGAGMPIIAPLYVYPLGDKTPNLNKEIVTNIEQTIGKKVKPEKLFDYIYAVLHSPQYRKDYEEFLKIVFPRIPYPENNEEFEHFAKFGTKLRQLHLMEKLPKCRTTFPIADGNEVSEIRYVNGRVYINKTQYFDNVSESTWQFYVGGYQPLQKYLKDRKGRVLTFEEIKHYQNVVSAIDETLQLMNELG